MIPGPHSLQDGWSEAYEYRGNQQPKKTAILQCKSKYSLSVLLPRTVKTTVSPAPKPLGRSGSARRSFRRAVDPAPPNPQNGKLEAASPPWRIHEHVSPTPTPPRTLAKSRRSRPALIKTQRGLPPPVPLPTQTAA
ncbi:hypothetical protein SKAU_G00111700 [Synaphobranchus kaupii]|uniref:Uncharacterized protein n=1 Tax=Synaphobranchus kaupii TaxID=118154 RepID=A0A9Q1G0V3_SYNKA|nr:hypothetical protein SKAU_G00111700 [Synaphobranchus kaupii]